MRDVRIDFSAILVRANIFGSKDEGFHFLLTGDDLKRDNAIPIGRSWVNVAPKAHESVLCVSPFQPGTVVASCEQKEMGLPKNGGGESKCVLLIIVEGWHWSDPHWKTHYFDLDLSQIGFGIYFLDVQNPTTRKDPQWH